MGQEIYPNIGTTRWIVDVYGGGGSTVILDDGSLWRLDQPHPTILGWHKTALVTIGGRKVFEAEYILSSEDGREAQVTYMGFGALGHSSLLPNPPVLD